MKLRFRTTVCSMLTAIVSGLPIQAEEFIIRTDRPGAEIQPTMYGLFFEDINYAADGGLYAEMVKNRSFEFPQNLMGWESFGAVALLDDGPFDRNPHYVRLSAAPHKDKATGLTNEGGYIVKIANTSDSPKDITLNFQKLKKGRSLADGRIITLSAPLRSDGTPDLDCNNTLENPERIIPVESILPASGNTATLTLPAKTFAVCRIPIAG